MNPLLSRSTDVFFDAAGNLVIAVRRPEPAPKPTFPMHGYERSRHPKTSRGKGGCNRRPFPIQPLR